MNSILFQEGHYHLVEQRVKEYLNAHHEYLSPQCVVDVKAHREQTKFNMPILTSVERLSRFYVDDKNFFALLFVKYMMHESRTITTSVCFVPNARILPERNS